MLSQSFLQIYRILRRFILSKRFQKFEILLAANYSINIIFFFQTSTPSNVLNLNLPRSVQQLTHGQMEFYTNGAVLFML